MRGRRSRLPLAAAAATLASTALVVAPAAARAGGGLPAPARGAQESDRPAATDVEPGWIWAVFGGYGHPQVINGSSRIAIASAGARLSYAGSLRGSGTLRGHPAFAVEILPVTAFLPEFAAPDAWGGGFNLLYEHRFQPRGRVMPVFRVGAGGLYTDREVPPGEVRFNFSLLVGLGVDFRVTPGTALGLEYRIHHVSNANRGLVNPGVNAHTLLFGISFFR